MIPQRFLQNKCQIQYVYNTLGFFIFQSSREEQPESSLFGMSGYGQGSTLEEIYPHEIRTQ